MVRIHDPAVYKSVTRRSPMASSPRILNRSTGTDQASWCAKSSSRSSSSLRVLREPDRKRRDEDGFPAPNKEPATNQKHDLTGKAPYRFESTSLQRRGRSEPRS